MVLERFSTDLERKSLGYRRQGGDGQGDRAVVGQVKELVVGVSHQTAPICDSLCGPCGCKERRRGEVSACLPLSPPLHPLDRVERVGSEGKERNEKEEEKETARLTERRENTPQAQDG